MSPFLDSISDFPVSLPACNTFFQVNEKVKQIMICSKLLRRRHWQFFQHGNNNSKIPKFFLPLKTLTWFMITCHFPNLDKGENTHKNHQKPPFICNHTTISMAESVVTAVRHLSGYGFLSRTSWSGAQPLSQSRWVSQGFRCWRNSEKSRNIWGWLSRMEDVQKWDGVVEWMDSNGDVRINGLLKTSENTWDILWLEPVMTSWLLKNVRLEAPSKGFFPEERRFGCLTKERIRPADDEGRWSTKTQVTYTHTIHGTIAHLPIHEWLIFTVNYVGKYTIVPWMGHGIHSNSFDPQG